MKNNGICSSEFKITRTYGLKDMRSIRWTHCRSRKTGWEIVKTLAGALRLGVSEFALRYCPSVYADHVEFSVWRWNEIGRVLT